MEKIQKLKNDQKLIKIEPKKLLSKKKNQR